MDKYDPERRCPKCGGVATGEYCRGGYDRGYMRKYCYEVRHDHLHRYCIVCGYEWVEKCLDDE